MTKKTIAIDTETWLIEPGRVAPKLVCVSWSDGTNTGIIANNNTALEWVHRQLDNRDVLLVGHNVAFDFGVLCQADPTLIPKIWAAYDADRVGDTMIHERLRKIAMGRTGVDPEQGNKRPRYSLASLVDQYFGEKVDGKGEDAWRMRYHELDGVPMDQWPDAASEYARLDALFTWRLWTSQSKTPQFDFFPQCRYAWALHCISAWGMRTDPDAVNALRDSLRTEIDLAKDDLVEAGVVSKSGSKNMAAIRKRVEAAYGDGAAKTAKGSTSTARAVLEESGDAVLESLARIGATEKILSTYVPALEQGTERPLNPRYSLVDSGRTSASGPNIQNMPRKGGVRECFVPRPGMVYACADYSIAELCSLAQVLLDMYGKSEMAEALQKGRELHLAVAAQIVGLSYEETVQRYGGGDPIIKQARQLAKAANFGFPGGLGAETFSAFAKAAYGVEISQKRAKELRETWLRTYPEMRRYFSDIGEMAGASGSFTAIHHRSGRRRGGVGFTNGCNTLFQGLAADGAKAAVYAVVKETHTDPDSALWGSHVVAFIHDEIIIESPADRAADAADRLSAVMVCEMAKWLPDIPVHAEAHLMDRWHKDAEPVRDDAGRLMLWQKGSP